jgi:hypothetical protein
VGGGRAWREAGEAAGAPPGAEGAGPADAEEGATSAAGPATAGGSAWTGGKYRPSPVAAGGAADALDEIRRTEAAAPSPSAHSSAAPPRGLWGRRAQA